jgi:DMSO/TMAO reductase YedYZ molybdopterin-dependent catalytic subunit
VATQPAADSSTPVGRRLFLGLLAAGAAGVVWGAKVQDWLDDNAGSVLANVPGAPVQRFRLYTVTGEFPYREPKVYRLSVGGLVDNPMELTYDDLLSYEPLNFTKDFQCVTGWRVDDVQWRGVRLADILDDAGVQSSATALQFGSFDGTYTESLTLEQARRDDVMVAYQMLGGDISREHGGPVRLYVAPMYGYKSIKWLDRIDATEEVIPGYWEELGYDVDAWIGESNGRDDEPV